MSIQFNDTTNKSGILQRIEQELGFVDGFITGNTTRLARFTASVNLALDKVLAIIFMADGKWQFDDGNHTTYPILTGDLTDGQRDYSFVQDSDSNLILTIDRVFVRMTATEPYYEIFPVDVQSDREGLISGLADGLNNKGRPQYYDKTATGLFLDPIPNASVVDGLKIYVSREGSYFTVSDTTKKPGIAGLYHEYLVLEPSYRYARANNMELRKTLKRDVLEMESKIEEFYSKRSRDERTIMTPEFIIYE